ncbi:hypothetical protein LguiB_004918 [Lonicera macranthoides]
MTIFSFGNPILLRSIRTCSLMNDPMKFEVCLQLSTHIFPTIITSENLNSSIILCTDLFVKSLKQTTNFAFGFHGTNPCHSSAIINKRDKPSYTT